MIFNNDSHDEEKTVFTCEAQTSTVVIDKKITDGKSLPFISHKGNTPFATALAMNIDYSQVLYLRKVINQTLNLNLKFLTTWDPNGEAHITTITPPEYDNILKPFVSIEKIEEIALANKIQDSDVDILGLGHGQKELAGKIEETFFLIAQSKNLLKIRNDIYAEFIKNGGSSKNWNPNSFYPHITIGFTQRDLHESDGVIKDLEHSQDSRFKIIAK